MTSTTSTSTGAATRTSIPASSRTTTARTLLRNQFTGNRVAMHKTINVGLMAELAAERFGRSVPIYLDAPFLWDQEQRVELDYVDFAELVEQFSAVLVAAGVSRFDRVAIVKTPNYDIQALAWAAARIGAIPALVSAKLDPDIVNILLDRLHPAAVITDPEVALYAGLTPERLKDLGAIAIADIPGGLAVSDLWGAPVPVANPVKNDDTMMITHTSSTTGVSKLAKATPYGTHYSTMMETVFPGLHEGSGELFASAISHVHIRGAITQAASMSRGTPLLGIGQPTQETVLDLFARYRPTIVEAHPNAFMSWEQIATDPADPFASIRIFLNTFDAIHPRTIKKLLAASQRSFPLWFQCYGMTETQVVTVRPYTRRSAARLGADSRSVGWPVPGVRVRIADVDTGKKIRDQHKPGMIQVRSRAITVGFVATPEKYSDRRHGKWFDTGDWGRVNGSRQLEVLDRVADRIEGVDSCLFLEDTLLDRIPEAEEIVIVPSQSGRPVPVITMRAGHHLSEQAWQAASVGLPELDAPFEVPIDGLRRTATVKARRYLLAQMVERRDQTEPTAEIVLREGA